MQTWMMHNGGWMMDAAVGWRGHCPDACVIQFDQAIDAMQGEDLRPRVLAQHSVWQWRVLWP